MRIVGWLRDLFRKKHHWYAVKHKRTGAWFTGDHGDPWSVEFGRSEWYDEACEAMIAVCLHVGDFKKQLDASLLQGEDVPWQLMRLTLRFDSNHYKMKPIPWSW